MKRYLVLPLLIASLFSCRATAQEPALNTQWGARTVLNDQPWQEYPRPQLQRKNWLCLNGWWDYIGGKDIADAGQPMEAMGFSESKEKIKVPFCPESVLSGIHRKQEINMWYRRYIDVPATWAGKNLLLHFDAVDHDATVFVNGQKAGAHSGGYDAFTVDITPFLKGRHNEIIVAARDLNDGQTPSGKNGPRGDYTYTSGIWQTVWMEPVSSVYIKDIKLTPDVAGQALGIRVSADSPSVVRAIVLDGGRVVASSAAGSTEGLKIKIPAPKLWTPDAPFLYQLRLVLSDGRGRVYDQVESYFGMRDIRIGRLNGVNRPLLNGKFVMQVGLLDQGYWPDGVLTPPSDAAMVYDMMIMKKAGFNLIRKHMKVEPQRFYYWADKLGLMVWQDMPAIWFQDEDTAVNRPRYRAELKALIDGHYNSPSIIAWVPFNENWGAFDVREITDWIKAYDPTRLVCGNAGFNNNPTYQKAYGDPGNGDFVDTHHYAQPYKISMPDKTRAAAMSEFGGVGLFVHDHMWPVFNNSYVYTPTRETLTAEYLLFMNQIDNWMKYRGLSVAVYTQTTDVEHEINGIITYDRAVLKVDLPKVRAVNRMVIEDSYKMQNPGVR